MNFLAALEAMRNGSVVNTTYDPVALYYIADGRIVQYIADSKEKSKLKEAMIFSSEDVLTDQWDVVDDDFLKSLGNIRG
jgi:hypothetical protein